MKIDDSIQLKDSDGQLTKSQLSLNINVPHAEIFDNLAELASNLCGTSIAFISLIDNDRHWFQAGVGLERIVASPEEIVFCAHALLSGDVAEISDASQDVRFSNNSLVTHEPHIRFYAGAPIFHEQQVIGTLSVMDTTARTLTQLQKKMLNGLAQYIPCVMNYQQEALSQNKNITNLLSEIVGASEDAIISKTLDGNVTSWNKGAENIFGFTANEMIGNSIERLFPADKLSEEVALMHFIRHDQPVMHFETARLKKNGEKIDVSISVSPLKDATGTIIGASKIARDITNRKKNERRIQLLGNLYKGISTINQAIVRLSPETELLPMICSCAVEYGEMSTAFVVKISEDKQAFEVAAQFGYGSAESAAIQDALRDDTPDREGLIATCFNEIRPLIVHDVRNDTVASDWRSAAEKLNWHSAAVFPILKNDSAFAVLAVCSTEPEVFDQEITFNLFQMARDVTFALNNLQREANRAAAEKGLKLAASVFESSNEGIMILDASNIVVAVNPAFSKITGFPESEILGFPPRYITSNAHDKEQYETAWGQVAKIGYWQGEIWNQRKNGEIYSRWQTINTVFNTDGDVQQRIVMFTDNTEKNEAAHKVWLQANFDNLTNLPNRQMFYDRLEQELKKAPYSDTSFALLLLDIDRFKEVNDTLGHDKGDELLKEIGRRLTTCVRSYDTVARLGGDEFTIIMSGLKDENVVEIISQEILDALKSDLYLDEMVLNITASIGISVYPRDGSTVDALMKKADQAMYAAKEAGKNNFAFFTQSMHQSLFLRMQTANDLKSALPNSELWVAYQPIVELASGHIYKAEALVRWAHPTRKISPAEFIPIAESTGMINEIGEFVFKESLKQVRLWQQTLDPKFQISINKSPLQFRSKGHGSNHWDQLLAQYGLSGNSVAVEITEGLLLDSNPDVINILDNFRHSGMQISIDDFGTGYSALSYLKKFQVDFLKIDKSFVDNICTTPADLALCEAIIMMSHKLNIKVIAEGVETLEQMQCLKAIGCDYGQGYYWSKPLPADEFEAFLQRSKFRQIELLS